MTVPLKVTVSDAETGEVLGERICVPSDYVIIANEPCYVESSQVYPANGVHVLTIKGHRPRKDGASC